MSEQLAAISGQPLPRQPDVATIEHTDGILVADKGDD
jgi:hypothetical protein